MQQLVKGETQDSGQQEFIELDASQWGNGDFLRGSCFRSAGSMEKGTVGRSRGWDTASRAFWTSEQAKQNLFNVEILKPLYEKYHKRGFDIFQVSLDTDKVKWATTIMGQELPWTNVCDTRGAASPYVSMYNLYYQTESGNVGVAVPAAFVIHNGELIDGQVVDEASFKKLLEQLL